MVKKIIIMLIFGVLCAVGGYLYGVRDNGTTANEVRDQLNNTQKQQQQITGGLKDAEGTINESGRIIEECESVLRQVRCQPKSKTEKN